MVAASPACVGDDPVVTGSPDAATTSTPTGSTTTTSTPDGSTPPPADAGDAAAPTCSTGLADCDGNPATVCETDTRTNATHCGACNRTCGGTATCQAGDCLPEKLTDALNKPFGLALAGPRLIWHEGDLIRGCRTADCNASKIALVDVNMGAGYPTGAASPRQIYVEGTNFYFSQCGLAGSGCGIAVCDVGGCKLTGATSLLADNGGYRRASWVSGSNGQIFMFQGLDGLSRVDIAAKTLTGVGGTYRVGDTVQAVDSGPQRFVYVDDSNSIANPVGGLFMCPASGCTAAPTRLLPPPIRHLAIAARTAYVATGGANAGSGSVIACDTGGCSGAGTVVATNQAYVSDIAADTKDIVWTTTGAQNVDTNTAAVGTVMRCGIPCTTPVKVAEAQVNPVAVQMDADYIYWVQRGTNASPNGSVWRKRR